MIEIVLGFAIYIGLSIWLTLKGSKRRIGWFKSLLASVFLTPLIGYLIVNNSHKNISYYETHYHCSRCGFDFTEKYDYCPLCEQDSHLIKLKKVKKEMT